ncbi:hypothetical protein AWJ20_1481 [Sugiyamaella lignohabitans]|uniref:RRM domain-containing protein n=1 Tax=Sugiyamaella lignohabitans TaxID=796027 RepID=A0A167DR99_9ASCO|nr:uncharacterized protein AWJ20_1481 [Sugiyamaella lignohabitans]ANB13199.1 hypothetical protein AWJ20_1481 [Sugiyamaella lignohabitans]
MTFQDFMSNDQYGSVGGASWADDDLPSSFSNPLPPSGGSRGGDSSWGRSEGSDFGRRGPGADRDSDGWTRAEPSDYRRNDREPVPIPDSAPFTARLLNLDYEVAEENIKELFADSDKYKVVSVRLPRDSVSGRLRGYGFVEFETRDSLVEALKLDGTSLLNRSLRVVVSERREDDKFSGDWRSNQAGPLSGGPDDFGPRRRRGSGGAPGFDDNRDYDNWERRGPLPPRGGDRPDRRGPPVEDDSRDYDNWERRGPPAVNLENVHPRYRRHHEGEEGGEAGLRRGPRPPREDDGRDYENWERRGPPAGGPPHDERRRSSRNEDDGKERDFDNWERRGPLPPRRREPREPREPREGKERPVTEADNNSDWRGSRGGPSASGQTTAPRAGRKKLDLKPRTVSAGSSNDAPSPNDSHRSSVFGSAKPVDTTKKLEEVGEKYVQHEHERFEAEKKHRDEIKAREEERKQKDEAKAEQLRKRFEVLKTEDDDEDETDAAAAAGSQPADSTAAGADEPKKDQKTAAEALLTTEATPEELESGDWNVVPNKRGGRK